MKKTFESRQDRSVAGHFSPSHGESPGQDKNYLFFDKEQTIFLTSLIGTQLLLTTSFPDYPLVKATEIATEKIS